MTRITKHFLVIFFVTGVYSAAARAQTISAASCNQADVNAAIASAVAGDRVLVPAGTCAWSGGISISGISLIGAGSSISGTVITTGTVTITKSSTQHTRLSGIRFTGTDQHTAVGGNPTDKAFRIDNCYFFTDGTGNMMGITVNGGVIDHNTITATQGTNADIMSIRAGENWSQAPTYGTLDTTGERNIYFEDNTITNILETFPDGD